MLDEVRIYRTARRTTVKQGQAEEYLRTHARIPEVAAAALRANGIVRWDIWRDGDRLIHIIDSVEPYTSIIARMRLSAPPDPTWAARIASLLSSEPRDDSILEAVWGLDARDQWAGERS